MYDEIPLHVVESVLSLCYIRGTGETSVSHRPPELPANGECESPISIPDLEAELEAHGLLLVLPRMKPPELLPGGFAFVSYLWEMPTYALGQPRRADSAWLVAAR